MADDPERSSENRPAAVRPGGSAAFLGVVLLGFLVWFWPVPAGVDVRAWHLLAIFVATVIGIMLRPLPIGAVAIIGVTATVLTGTLDISEALSGFGNRVVWLIVVAFLVARAFTKTGLGARVAYSFMAYMGRSSLGLAYSLVATDLVLAPTIPSNSARAGGVLFPILFSLSKAYGSDPDDGTARKIGAFLTFTVFQGNLITSAMFLTGQIANPLIAELAGDLGVEITWGSWALAALVPGVASLVVIPLFIYLIYPPETKRTPDAVEIARRELTRMGPVKTDEWVLLAVFITLLTLWISGERLDLHATSTGLAGVACCCNLSSERRMSRGDSTKGGPEGRPKWNPATANRFSVIGLGTRFLRRTPIGQVQILPAG